ncbi:MAG: AI-2E family transporter [Agathobaculum sp.]|uniref:AI-2E family transporter n=1 Tax=Agathobaculum sp. TaxID=2048138 RepID=UPI0025B99078|nr:AI-2E family transporter [Agathobaculum sp.]MCI7124837.1 AI-2E family transporter [Agathobaculum sp.]MDY3710959.1 AI-2E family transporter [Agathobaculum sp.]
MQDPTQRSRRFLREQPHYFQWGLTAFLVILACVFVVYLLNWLPILWSMFKKLLGILSPFIYGFVMAYLLMPIFNGLYRWIAPRWSKRVKGGAIFVKGLCSVLTLLIGLATVAALLSMVLPQLIVSIFSLLESLDGYLEEISGWAATLFRDNPVLERNFMQIYDQFSAQVVGWVENIALPQLVSLMTGVVTTVSVLFDLLIGMIIALYILNSKDTFCAQAKKVTYSLFRIETANRIIKRVAHIHRIFGGFITGKLIDSMIIGVLCFAGLRVLMAFHLLTIDQSYALLISVIIGVTNIIPFFGPFIGAIPSAILIMVISPLQTVYFVLFILLLQQFDGNILGPKILGNSTGLSSFWVMFAILLAGGVFGFVGMAVGVPLFAVLYSVLTETFNNLLKKRGLSTDTNDYRGTKRLDPETKAFVESTDEMPPVSAKERRAAAEKARAEQTVQAETDAAP